MSTKFPLPEEVATEAAISLMREYFNQMIGIINEAQAGNIPEDVAKEELDKIERYWAEKLVAGLK